MSGERTCVVWCPDWPVVVACRRDPALAGRPVAVRERVGPREVVRSASPEARELGVTTGLRRREAEARGAELVVLDVDHGAEAAAFEEVARAVEVLTPRVEITRAGLLSFPTRGPSRYFGGDAELAVKVRAVVGDTEPGGLQAAVGVADGQFAACLAARRAGVSDGTLVVPPGGSAAFLAPFPVRVLGDPELADLLVRLGLPTLGDFAALPGASVLARFGSEGHRLHRRAGGFDDHLPGLAPPPADLVESIELDPPAARVDQAAFAAKTLADRLLARLAEHGLGCTRIVIEAETEHGESLARCWRHEGALTPAALVERVRWQLDGWLQESSAVRERALDDDVRARQDAGALAASGDTSGALSLLRLRPDEMVPVGARQLGFWGGDQAAAERADRALSRVQGMLGEESVVVAVFQGGRTPTERVRWVPWGAAREPRRPLDPVRGPVAEEAPAWPGRVPGPAPARVFDPPLPARLLDERGDPVQVSGRGEASAPPAVLRSEALVGGGGPVVGWAGPWLHDVRWWDHRARRRRALWQVTVAAGAAEVACLVAVEGGRAAVAAIHD